MGYYNSDWVITDLTVVISAPSDSSATRSLDPRRWHRLEKDLFSHTAKETAWLHIAHEEERKLNKSDDLVVTDVRIGGAETDAGLPEPWENRSGGIWILRSPYTSSKDRLVTGIEVLFGVDAVDPRPQWSLLEHHLRINTPLVARLSIRRGIDCTIEPQIRPPLVAQKDGTFKIVQIADTHMVTGVGVCKDAIDGGGKPLPESVADPLTKAFIYEVLEVEKPDLAVLTGDQLHHDISDSQTALYKVVAPFIERAIPYAAVFGNHDTEGAFALSRTAQMGILRDLPYSLCQSGPEHVDGIGNYHIQISSSSPERSPKATLYFLDSHGQLPSKVRDPDYEWIKQRQIDWFTRISSELREQRISNGDSNSNLHLSLTFMHIPLPEYAEDSLAIIGGERREPTEGPTFNSNFYQVLAAEGVAAVACGHDHVNDFCGLRMQPKPGYNDLESARLGPWLCYGGCCGYGGYCSYDRKRFHRRCRVWELDTRSGCLKTWERVEYNHERVDEVLLVQGGIIVPP